MKTFITITTGAEGPRHDSYGFMEITVQRGSLRAVAHLGLMVWVERDGARTSCDERTANDMFEDACGLSITQAQRAARKLRELPYREHRTHGGFKWMDGFPGESLCLCKCGAVVDSELNEGAIR